MKKLFDQSRGSTAHITNMLSLARSFGLHDNEVVYAKVGTKLVNIKGIYDNKTSTFWLVPELVGSELFSFSAPVLTTDKETVDLTEHNLKFENYHIKHGYSFSKGFEITNGTQVVNFEDYLYRWDGNLPKLVPAGSTPNSAGGVGIGAWVSVGDASLRTVLRESSGSSNIGVYPSGNIQQMFTYVTPEQFGAIGDGTYHPLSARFNSLPEAREIYPHVSSLSQSIDWAACQAAENYARNKAYVKCPETAKYHFGDSDYLELQSNSRWQGAMTSGRIPSEVNCTTMIRSVPAVKPPFGRDTVVRVMNAADSGSNDEFVRGIVFEGFLLTRGVPRRSIVKGKGTMCLHMNNGINSRIDVTCFGSEYGVFGYCFWGTTGRVQCDTCRIGFYADAITETPERHGKASGGSNTSFNIRVQMDVVTFGIVLRGCAYSTFTGWIEDAVIGTATYDHINETAIAITMLECNGVNIQSVGIEEWQGVFVYARRSGGDINIPYAQQYAPNNITGRRDGPYSVISSQMIPPQEQPFTLPSGDLALLYMKGNTSCTIKGMSGDMSGSNYNNIYLINLDDDAKIIFQNTGVYMGGNFARVAPGNYRSINVINDKYLIRAISPSNDDVTYDYLGWSTYRHRNFVDGQIAANGSIKINFNSNYKFVDVSAFVVTGSNTGARNYGAITCSDFSQSDSITLQTGLDVSGYALRYKLTLQRK